VSGRALAAAARRAGFVPLVADRFADADTGRIAQACIKLDGGARRGFAWTSLADALEALAEVAPSPLLGLVYGAGFEDRPSLLAKLAQRFPVLGNDAATVDRVKDPAYFFGMLARLGIPHPRTLTEPPHARDGLPATTWLAKRQGGAGGSHVAGVAADLRNTTGSRAYYQEKVEGGAVSALFVGNGETARVLGFSEQWTTPTKAAPWRYGGAVAPAALGPDLERRMIDAVERVASAFGLKGLGSADFLTNEDEIYLLEINPRPGATLDVFDSDELPLLGLHFDAMLTRRLPAGRLPLVGGSAAAIVYATEPVTVSNGMDWPVWTGDQPRCGERIDKNRPICTVWARSAIKAEARRLVEERISFILAACTG
jgi:uncharacterized protein